MYIRYLQSTWYFIIRNDMYIDGLHLLLSGKFLVSNNFIENINYLLG